MLDQLRTKIRALVEDNPQSDFETFEYKNSNVWTISEPNILTIEKVLKNGSELGSGEYDFDSITNKIEILVSLTTSDIIEVDYTYSKYSDTELNSFITASLVWLSVYGTSEQDYEMVNDTIDPAPSDDDIDLIAFIVSILIEPDYTEYRLPNLTVRYNNRNLTKEKRIELLIQKFNGGIGVSDVLEL